MLEEEPGTGSWAQGEGGWKWSGLVIFILLGSDWVIALSLESSAWSWMELYLEPQGLSLA